MFNPNTLFEEKSHSVSQHILHFLIVTIIPDLPYQVYFRNKDTNCISCEFKSQRVKERESEMQENRRLH